MPINGLPVGSSDDTVTVTPTGFFSVDAQGGDDLLRVRYGALATNVEHRYVGSGYNTFTDDVASGITYLNFERFDVETGSGDDSVNGGGGNDIFATGAGADIIAAGSGRDVLDGGAGYDLARFDWTAVRGDVRLNLHPSDAVTEPATGTSVHRIEALDIASGPGDDRIDTRRVLGDDTVRTGDGNDSFATDGGRDSFDGGNQTDTLIVDYSAATHALNQTYEGSGWSRIYLRGGMDYVRYYGVERFDITGGAGDDIVYGEGGNDVLTGNDGDDWLNGKGGYDTISGGAGTDTWEVNYTGTASENVVDLVAQTTNNRGRISGIERIHYTGCVAEDSVTALPGVYDDWLATADGDDRVVTGRGQDRLDAGGGTDTMVMDWSGIDDPLAGITNTYLGSGWYRYEASSGDRLDYYSVEVVDLTGGAGADDLAGGGLRDTLRGGDGDDTLNGAQERDRIYGGAGDDLWMADLSAATKSVAFDAGKSQRKAQGGKSGVRVSEVEAVDVTTGAGKDKIFTKGYALDDAVRLNQGNDKAHLGLGYNSADGGPGTDLLIADLSSATTDVSVSYRGSGWYRISDAAHTTHTDYYSFERFAFTGGEGNDALDGGNGNDRLLGRGGNDTLNGMGGKDVLDGGPGTDTAMMNHDGYTRRLSLTLDGSGKGKLEGIGTKLKAVENVHLNTGQVDDRVDLSALAGDDNVYMGAGDDRLDIGRGRHDTANGGAGNDLLVASAADATAGARMVYAGSGWWTLEARDGSYDLDFREFERLDLTGTARGDRLEGFGDADTLRGGASHDILDGKAGDDLLVGGAGRDVFVFSDRENAGADTVADAGSGDRLRVPGTTLASVMAGDGSDAVDGAVEIQSGGGTTVVHVALDGTPGADLSITLTGSFGVSDFTTDGSDLILV